MKEEMTKLKIPHNKVKYLNETLRKKNVNNRPQESSKKDCDFISGCEHGYFGENCQESCACPDDVECDNVVGTCLYNCPAGLTGRNCSSCKYYKSSICINNADSASNMYMLAAMSMMSRSNF